MGGGLESSREKQMEEGQVLWKISDVRYLEGIVSFWKFLTFGRKRHTNISV